MKISGVDRVEKVYRHGGAKVATWDRDSGFRLQDEWVLETEGTNLTGIRFGLCRCDAHRQQRHC